MQHELYSDYPIELTAVESAYAEFIKSLGYSGEIILVRPAQVLLWYGKCYIKNPGQNQTELSLLYAAHYKDFGARIDGIGTIGSKVVAQITLPMNDITGDYRMVGQKSLGYSMFQKPFTCKAVRSDLIWWLLSHSGGKLFEEEPQNIRI